MRIKNIKYTDIPFFISKNRFTNDVNVVTDLSAIRQSVKNIIMSIAGDRPFDYGFGAGMHNALFETITLELIMGIQARISSNLAKYEQRVSLNDVLVEESTEEENTLQVTVDFSIPSLNVRDVIRINLVRTR